MKKDDDIESSFVVNFPSGKGDLPVPHRNANMKNKDHLVGEFTGVTSTSAKHNGALAAKHEISFSCLVGKLLTEFS